MELAAGTRLGPYACALVRNPWHEMVTDHHVLETVISSNGNWVAHAMMGDSADLYVLEPPRAP